MTFFRPLGSLPIGAIEDPEQDYEDSGFWRADHIEFDGSPWKGVGTRGYALGRDLSEATNPPSAGTAQNGYVPAQFDGTNDILRYTGAEEIVGDNTGWAFTWVGRFGSLDAPSGAAPAEDGARRSVRVLTGRPLDWSSADLGRGTARVCEVH